MHLPPAFAVDDPTAALADLLEAHAATLVTYGPDGFEVSVVPLLVVARAGGGLVLQGHLARPNPQASLPAGTPAVATVVGPQGYVTPSWYPTKAETGKVVPTWDYVVATAAGTLHPRPDPEWLHDLVTRLTERHEARRAEPWAVTDAPEGFVRRQLGAIVGIELEVERVEAKAKLSQNRSDGDVAGVVSGLRDLGPRASALADAVEAARRDSEPDAARR